MASGDTLIVFTPQMGEPPSTSYATHDIRNQHPVLDFALTEEIRFSGVMPRHYGGSGVTIYLHYAMSTGITSNDIKLETDFERIGDQQLDIDADGFTESPQNTGDITVPGTSGNVDIVSTTHTDGAQMDSVAVGEGFRIEVRRVAVAGTDAAGDLELRFVEIKET